MEQLPASKQWEMYEAVMRNCNDCAQWKHKIETEISDIKTDKKVANAVTSLIKAAAMFVIGIISSIFVNIFKGG